MDADFFEKTAEIYRLVDHLLQSGAGENRCGACRTCCTSAATQGVSALELDYIGACLAAAGRPLERLERFTEYISKNKDGEGNPLHGECPFYDALAQGCAVYEARPLSCRAFGRVIREESLSLIPDGCALKKDVVLYTDETFPCLVPFALPFYALVSEYAREKGAPQEE